MRHVYDLAHPSANFVVAKYLTQAHRRRLALRTSALKFGTRLPLMSARHSPHLYICHRSVLFLEPKTTTKKKNLEETPSSFFLIFFFFQIQGTMSINAPVRLSVSVVQVCAHRIT